MRHRGGAFLAFREKFLRLQNFSALQMPDLSRKPLDGRGDDAKRCEIHGVTVTRDDLGRDWLDL